MSFYTKNSIALKQKELRSFCLIYSIPPALLSRKSIWLNSFNSLTS
nr:MAG TPA: hypothetical protein [Crassvirales sp.]